MTDPTIGLRRNFASLEDGMFTRAISRMADADQLLMRRVEQWTPRRWLRLWMIGATRAGDGWLWGCCGISVLAAGRQDAFRAFGTAAGAVAVGIVLFQFLKRAVNRRRPAAYERVYWHNL